MTTAFRYFDVTDCASVEKDEGVYLRLPFLQKSTEQEI